jgi:hypothetical protein
LFDFGPSVPSPESLVRTLLKTYGADAMTYFG